MGLVSSSDSAQPSPIAAVSATRAQRRLKRGDMRKAWYVSGASPSTRATSSFQASPNTPDGFRRMRRRPLERLTLQAAAALLFTAAAQALGCSGAAPSGVANGRAVIAPP